MPVKATLAYLPLLPLVMWQQVVKFSLISCFITTVVNASIATFVSLSCIYSGTVLLAKIPAKIPATYLPLVPCANMNNIYLFLYCPRSKGTKCVYKGGVNRRNHEEYIVSVISDINLKKIRTFPVKLCRQGLQAFV
jgi:hypothetical protein